MDISTNASESTSWQRPIASEEWRVLPLARVIQDVLHQSVAADGCSRQDFIGSFKAETCPAGQLYRCLSTKKLRAPSEPARPPTDAAYAAIEVARPDLDCDVSAVLNAVLELERIAGRRMLESISEFDASLAEYRHARAEFERIIELGDDDAGEIAGNVSDEAFERMLKTPGANIGDIAIKIDIFLFEYLDSPLDEDRLALIAQDARRLAGRA